MAEQPSFTSRTSPTSPPRPRHRGRVRTGCLVCRARKVKCDERRPTCRKCARLNKQCVYRLPDSTGWAASSNATSSTDLDSQPLELGQQDHIDMVGIVTAAEILSLRASGDGTNGSFPGQDVLLEQLPQSIPRDNTCTGQTLQVTHSSDESSPILNEHAGDVGYAEVDGEAPEAAQVRHERASQLIYLSTVVDWLAASEVPTSSSFCYFVQVVDCPFVSPFDRLNWARVKHHIAHLGVEQTSIAESLLAVQTVYRAQVDRLPMGRAMFLYQLAMTSFVGMLGDDGADFHVVLVNTFLLCLCVVTLPNEDGPQSAALDGMFVTRLEAWFLGEAQHHPVSLRICAWLQLLNTCTKRQGSAGILSAPALNLLHRHVKQVPPLPAIMECDDMEQRPGQCLYDAIAAPVFTFYLKLQAMSDRVASVTHYHRSRTTPKDQAEVTDLMATLNADLSSLWEHRPAPLEISPDQIRQHFSSQIAEPLIAFAGLCTAAFHAEIVIIGRILGDPPFPTPEARRSMQEIRKLVNGDWNLQTGSSLDPGYLRPIFVYALESFQEEDSKWAADRLRQIQHPCSRSHFLASFVDAHSDAQRAQSRRVTMKYFCFRNFGIPLPFM